jgi:hypothetical protein
MTIIRLTLGKLILLFNWVFTPRSVKRDPALQASIDEQTTSLTLYQSEACPFCVKVRRAMKRCVFQTKPATDSRRSLPPIPRESCH